jgi:hypothetical protein
MKITGFLLVTIFLTQAFLQAANPTEFNQFLRDIDKQTREFRNSPEHQVIKSSRDNREYQVGDQHTFWSWALNVMPPQWMQTPATCRAVGDHCYLFVADEEWNVHMDQSDVDEVMLYLEEQTMNSDLYGAIEMDTTSFGPMPDELDNDPKVIVFYMELGSFGGSTFDGYFSSYNQVTEAEAQQMNPPGHSNECEMIYMTCYPLQPDDPIRISVLSHELQHLIHWGRDINESIWVNEGCSELAMVLFGMPDPITHFPNNPDNSLIEWNQQFADYVKTMLFFTYLYEKFDSDGLIYDIVGDPANSLTGISNQLIEHGFQIPLNAVFANWTLANYIDDPEFMSGQYGYELLDLPQFNHADFISSFPETGSGSVEGWAAEYLRINTNDLASGSTMNLDFTTDSECNVATIYYQNSTVYEVIGQQVDGSASITLMNGEQTYDKLILAVINNDYNSLDYDYTITAEVVAADENLAQDINAEVTAYPNPVRSDYISFYINNTQVNTEVEIYNLKGQKIRELKTANSRLIHWDRKDKNKRPVSKGLYYYRLKNKHSKQLKKLMILK